MNKRTLFKNRDLFSFRIRKSYIGHLLRILDYSFSFSGRNHMKTFVNSYVKLIYVTEAHIIITIVNFCMKIGL